MSTQAQDKEAAKVATWVEGLAVALLRVPASDTILSTHDVAEIFRQLAIDIRAGEHRRKPEKPKHS